MLYSPWCCKGPDTTRLKQLSIHSLRCQWVEVGWSTAWGYWVGRYRFSTRCIVVPWTRREISGYVFHTGMWVDFSAELASLIFEISHLSDSQYLSPSRYRAPTLILWVLLGKTWFLQSSHPTGGAGLSLTTSFSFSWLCWINHFHSVLPQGKDSAGNVSLSASVVTNFTFLFFKWCIGVFLWEGWISAASHSWKCACKGQHCPSFAWEWQEESRSNTGSTLSAALTDTCLYPIGCTKVVRFFFGFLVKA